MKSHGKLIMRAKTIRGVHPADIVFLAHFTGSGIDAVLDMIVADFFAYLDEALKLYKEQLNLPSRVILAGIEKR